MEFKGTKGKWITDNENVYCDAGGIICRIDEQDVYNKDIEAMANAKLIAASPEMFEMLKDMLNGNITDLKDIRQLLKKITE